MELTSQTIGEVTVVNLNGRFDAFQAPNLGTWYETNLSPDTARVVLNLANVTFIDSLGLATIVKGMKRCREHGGDLVLCELTQAVRIIFEVTRMDQAIKIHENQDAAIAHFSEGA